MTIKVGGIVIPQWDNLDVMLKFDSISSTFSFTTYFEPYSDKHKRLFLPCKYDSVIIEHNGERVLTGVLLSYEFETGPAKKLISIGGYSITGVLEDCPFVQMTNGMSLKEIAEKSVGSFGLKTLINPDVAQECDISLHAEDTNWTSSVKDIISHLANQRHIIVSHNRYGDVILTRGNTSQKPIHYFNFKEGLAPATSIKLKVDGQAMHGRIDVVRQKMPGIAADLGDSLLNPYVANSGAEKYWIYVLIDPEKTRYKSTYRPKIIRETAENINFKDLRLVARNELAKELRAITLVIEMNGWLLGGKLVTPNMIVTVRDPELYLYRPTNFFVESVQLRSNAEKDTAVLTCVVPEVYNTETPINIFTGNYNEALNTPAPKEYIPFTDFPTYPSE